MCEQEEKKNKAGSEEVLDLNHGCPDNPFLYYSSPMTPTNPVQLACYINQ